MQVFHILQDMVALLHLMDTILHRFRQILHLTLCHLKRGLSQLCWYVFNNNTKAANGDRLIIDLIINKMKKFKLPVIIIIMTLGFIKNSPAQTQSNGLYLTYNDFKHDKLTAGGKGPKPVSTEYFSTKANVEILQLTQQNIDKAFASNYKFRNLVQAEFKTDDQLTEYDNALNKYEIKELYIESSK